MAIVDELAAFAVRSSYEDLTPDARAALRARILDSLGCALGALDAPLVRAVREQVDDLGGRPLCQIVAGGRTAPDRAAFCNGALVRYLDFNDAYLAPRETCHPSDNLAPVLAAAEYAHASGRDLMTALAVAYQVQCRLSDEAPVRARGFDHTTQGAYAMAAGVARALGLDAGRTANAVSMAGTAENALRVTRTGALSSWKGLAAPHTAFAVTHAALLAMRGITGPREVFEGHKGFMDAIAGRFFIDWKREDLSRVTATHLKRYDAEIHSQSAIEGILELRAEHALSADRIESVELDTFDVAYHIIGGGEEGDKTVVRTKEEADHSLPYLLAVAILDGGVMPEQYAPSRIAAEDVQALLRKVVVRPDAELSRRFPSQMPARLSVRLANGRVVEKEKNDYQGFVTRGMRWEAVAAKFHGLSASHAGESLRREIVDAVAHIDEIAVADLTRLLGSVPAPAPGVIPKEAA